MRETRPRYLDTKQAAAYLGLSPKTLVKMRVTGGGPRYAKVGRRVIYDVADLDSWVEKRKRRFTGESDGDCPCKR
ncbi:MAG: helix-turn-helix domain-containing protein [Alphaproteobacteria bacterium]|nr:helix-turn-helix domain-containing protein [Alphaproteobacteria bacterium]